MMRMYKLEFFFDWNKKLQCSCFTTIRLYNEAKYYPGNRLEVFLNNVRIKEVEVVENRKIMLSGINEFIAGLDTGHGVMACQEVIRKMYPGKDWGKQALSFVLLRTIVEEKDPLLSVRIAEAKTQPELFT